jgi:hypothetical protein
MSLRTLDEIKASYFADVNHTEANLKSMCSTLKYWLSLENLSTADVTDTNRILPLITASITEAAAERVAVAVAVAAAERAENREFVLRHSGLFAMTPRRDPGLLMMRN